MKFLHPVSNKAKVEAEAKDVQCIYRKVPDSPTYQKKENSALRNTIVMGMKYIG